jgi:mannitol/fructose-specific phosphotransferase system IIA component (Ntr-type)
VLATPRSERYFSTAVRFVGLLRPELVAVDPPWHGLRETIDGLTAALVATGALPPTVAAASVRAVVAREREASTAVLDIDVGLPHARVDGVPESVAALAVSARGLYEPVPTVPIHIVALVLSPLTATDDHLRVLASVATLLRSAALRQEMLAARSPEAVLGALRRHGESAP